MNPATIQGEAKSVYFVQPYNLDARGFYFSTLDEYEAKCANHVDPYGCPVEGYELQFIDGDNWRLFNALEVNQATLSLWFETFADLDSDDDDYLQAIYLAKNGHDMSEIPDRMDDIIL